MEAEARRTVRRLDFGVGRGARVRKDPVWLEPNEQDTYGERCGQKGGTADQEDGLSPGAQQEAETGCDMVYMCKRQFVQGYHRRVSVEARRPAWAGLPAQVRSRLSGSQASSQVPVPQSPTTLFPPRYVLFLHVKCSWAKVQPRTWVLLLMKCILYYINIDMFLITLKMHSVVESLEQMQFMTEKVRHN